MLRRGGTAAFVLRMAAVALVYFAAGRLGLSLAFDHGSVSPVCPPAGVAIATLLLGGIRYWPAIFVGVFAVNFTEFYFNDGFSVWAVAPTAFIAVGNTLEAVVSVALFRRYYGLQRMFASSRALAWGAFCLALVGVPLSASIGVGTLVAFSSAEMTDFWPLWTTWWTGDLAGAAIVAPAILVWFDGQTRMRRGAAAAVEAAVLLAALAGACLLVFGDMDLPRGSPTPLIYTLVPIVVLTVLRFGQRGGAVAVLVCSAVAIAATLRGYGPFALDSAADSLLFLQAFAMVMAGTTLFTAAVLEQRDQLARQVRRQNAELENRVRDRTAELSQANLRLQEHIEARKIYAEERLAMERRALEGQKLESLGVLTGGIAHDFNNLLVPILGYASLAKAKLPPQSSAVQDIEKIAFSANRAAALVRQLLVYAGKARLTMEPVCINTIVQEIDEILAVSTPKNVTTRMELGQDLPNVQLDVAQMTQVVLNLLRNASDAIGTEHGEIRVKTMLLEVDAATLAESLGDARLEPGEFLCLEVSDTGCGMDAKTRAHVFEPFFTTKERGRGLGLPAILGIIRSHGGAISIASAPGEGTVVRVLLPPYRGTARKAPIAAAEPSAAKLGGTVLVVDDDAQVLAFTRDALKAMGLEVIEAADGEEALLRFAEYEDVLTGVVLDLTMPLRSGAAVMESIRERMPELPIVLVSGYPDRGTLEKVESDPAAQFLQKPYAPGTLGRLLASLTGTQS